MVEESQLSNILVKKAYTKTEKIIICLGTDAESPKQVKQLRALAVSSGLRAAKKWNISQLLSNANELVVRVSDGWVLTSDGKSRVAELVGPFAASPIPVIASTLRAHIPGLRTEETKSFVEEAVECFESRKYRAAVVFTWVGAVSILQGHVLEHELSRFNAEAKRRDSKWKNARTTDDLSRMKEAEFLNVLVSLSIIGKNVKQQLENCLNLRNACGHPNSLKIGENMVSAHIETLLLNVFAKF